MLKPIATPHPLIIAGSLVALAGMIIYALSGLEKLDPSIAILMIAIATAVSGVCSWSQSRRVKEIAKEYSQR